MSDTNEFVVRVGRDRGTKYSMMRFNVPIELAQWNKIQKYNIDLARDMSKQRNFDLRADEGPQFGEGSEYRAREKEIARKMMMGHKIRKFDIDAQPWKMKVREQGKDTKKFTGTREGGIGDSSMYFVMRQEEGGVFKATPVEDWYNFKPEIKHRTLTHEEAEAEWERRDAIMNKFNFMNNKRLDDQIEGMEGRLEKSAGGSRKKVNDDLRIHGAEDDYVSSEDEFKRERKKQSRGKKNVGGRTAGEEAIEDSDDGDDEGQEVDYMSDDSSDFDDVQTEKTEKDRDRAGVDEKDNFMSSSEESEEEEKQEDEDQPKDESDQDSDIEGIVSNSVLFQNKKKSNSRSNTPTEELKVKAKTTTPLKRVREEHSPSPSGSNNKRARDSPTNISGGLGAITHEQVRAALSIKPITTRELLRKFKKTGSKNGLTQEQIVERVGAIMKTFGSEMTTNVKDGTKFFFIKDR